MAKISNDDINLIRSNANIVDIISDYINLEPKGKNFFGLCPFHSDHSPSLSVSPEKQIFTCFVCGQTGNVFSFIEKYEQTDFVSAVKIIADKIGYNLNIGTNTSQPYKKEYEIVSFANKYFINNLNSFLGKEAKEYLIKERKLSESVINEFQIGVALNDNGLSKILLSKGYSETDVLNASLASKSDELNDLFKNRITFPINNEKGEVVAFSARIYKGDSTSKYINSRESKIFKKGNILFNYDKCKLECSKTKSVILVEGHLDAIRVYASGIKNVCATMGTALTKDQINLLKKLNSKIILLMDNDSAGEKATISNGEELIKNNLDVSVVRLSEDKDPDSYILNQGINAFKTAIKGSISFFEFKMKYLKKDKDLNKSDELANYINNIINELNKSDDEILKVVTINKLSEDYNIDKSILEAKLIRKDNARIKVVSNKKTKVKLNKYKKCAEMILYAMMIYPKCIKKYQNDLNYFPDKIYKMIANDILAFVKIYSEFNLADFISYVSEFEYKDIILRIINDYQDLSNLEQDFDELIMIAKEWIKENQINELKEELRNELDDNRKEKLTDIIIKLKQGSGE